MEFDGVDDYVNFGDFAGTGISNPSIFGALSWGFWYDYTEGGLGTNDYLISTGAQTGSIGFTSMISHSTGSALYGGIRDNNYSWATDGVYFPSTDDGWVHTFWVWDGSALYHYLNGKQIDVDSSGAIHSYGDDATLLTIATPNNALAAHLFKGSIDDVRIYDYARTPAQIAWDYNRGKPIGHWKMDEGEGMTVYDHSGNGNHGTMTNMTNDDWVEGKVNGGLEFDGVDDYVDTGEWASDLIEDKVTVSAWVKYTGTTNPSWRSFFSNYDSGQGFGIRTTSADTFEESDIHAILRHTTWGYETEIRVKIADGGNFFNSKWHFVAFTANSETIRTYFNGSPSSTFNGNIVKISPIVSTIIGGGHSGGFSWWWGQIDDVRIYNYALTAEQVKEVYNGGAVRFR
jgi:hypothetical protein